MKQPELLTEQQIIAIESDPRYSDNWVVQSLIKTMMNERYEAQDRESCMKMEIGSLSSSLKWFEETYSTRALAPLSGPKSVGKKCPHCGKKSAANVGSEWCCFECKKIWSEEPEAKKGLMLSDKALEVIL